MPDGIDYAIWTALGIAAALGGFVVHVIHVSIGC